MATPGRASQRPRSRTKRAANTGAAASTGAAVRGTAASPPRRLLVAVDYSEPSLHALRRAQELSAAFGAELHVLHAWEAPYAPAGLSSSDSPSSTDPETTNQNLIGALQQTAREAMRQFLAGEDLSATPHQWFVVSGVPQTRVLEHATQHACDWIVLGTRGHHAVGRWLLGSVAQWVVRHAPCPVLVVSPKTSQHPLRQKTFGTSDASEHADPTLVERSPA